MGYFVETTANYEGFKADGFVIATRDGDIPDWIERGLPELDGVFPTRAAAQAALDESEADDVWLQQEMARDREGQRQERNFGC